MGIRKAALDRKTGFWMRTGCATGIQSSKITETMLGKKRLEGREKEVSHMWVPIGKKG